MVFIFVPHHFAHMRLFVSVDCDGRSDAIADLQAPLAGLSGLRPTDPTQAHATMKFLGEGEHDLDALSTGLETAVEEADIGPIELTFEGVGAFPSEEYITVVWLGVGRGSAALSELHRRIEAEMTALGYDAADHDFTPHVTLARMDDASSKVEVQRFLRESDPEIDSIRIEELRLKESTLTDDGPEHRTVERFRL